MSEDFENEASIIFREKTLNPGLADIIRKIELIKRETDPGTIANQLRDLKAVELTTLLKAAKDADLGLLDTHNACVSIRVLDDTINRMVIAAAGKYPQAGDASRETLKSVFKRVQYPSERHIWGSENRMGYYMLAAVVGVDLDRTPIRAIRPHLKNG